MFPSGDISDTLDEQEEVQVGICKTYIADYRTFPDSGQMECPYFSTSEAFSSFCLDIAKRLAGDNRYAKDNAMDARCSYYGTKLKLA